MEKGAESGSNLLKSVVLSYMHMTIQNDSITSVAQLVPLIKVVESLGVDNLTRTDGKEAVYEWMTDLLVRLRYAFLTKKEKGVVRTYLHLYSGYTMSHVDTLIGQYRKTGKIKRAQRTQPTFERTYTRNDIALLADVANAYNHQNGKALKEVCFAMYHTFGDVRFERLASISVSHLYNLKKTPTYRNEVLTYTKTKPTAVDIGERKKPYPEGKPGFLRVDSVHQGDLDKEKGVYHINLVDEVTQDEVVVCVEGISEQFLTPALEEALMSFPFIILNFHSDNGSEYINKTVARLLQKLLINQTKSRPRRSNDNGLAEGKNAAVVRKVMGHMHIPKKHARAINAFYREHLNPFVRFHRYCAFPEEEVLSNGKIVKRYREYATPIQKLLSLPHVEQYLRDGVTKESLLAKSKRQTHLEAAQEMQKARRKLFDSFKK